MNLLFRRTAALLALAAVVSVGAIACDDDDDDADSTATSDATTPAGTPTSGGTTTATTSPTNSASPGASASPGNDDGPTGDEDLDDIIAEVESGDTDALADRAQTLTLECTAAQGAGGPPQCETGEDEGSEVDVFPFAACQGEYVREDAIAELFQRELGASQPQLYAVFEIDDDGTDEFPRGDWGLLFETSAATGGAILIGVDDGGEIIDLHRGCNATAEQLFESQRDADGDVLVEPAP